MKNVPVRYFSTSLSSPEVMFSKALMAGLAPDGGLYMPLSIPVIKSSDIAAFSSLSYAEIAARVLSSFINDEIDESELFTLASDAYNFPIPVENAGDSLYILRLDQGPTASFKDFAARMMARLMQYFNRRAERNMVVLVATSGDTGSAIANAFHGLPGVSVVILFPKGEVTANQRLQMTTLGGNVNVLAVDGKFDDCQRMVKEAFTDSDLSSVGLTSANSINIGRLLPQSVYYFYAYSRLGLKPGSAVCFAVPSGNFGNMMGGMIAMQMGLPVERFIIATNMNDEFPEYLRTGDYFPVVPSRNCISNAMNVGHPSNLARLVALYQGSMNKNGNVISPPDLNAMRRDIFSCAVSDELSIETIKKYYTDMGITVEPHGATALAAVERYRLESSDRNERKIPVVALETAHPAKFPESVFAATGVHPPVPDSLKGLEDKVEYYEHLENDYLVLKEYLLSIQGH